MFVDQTKSTARRVRINGVVYLESTGGDALIACVALEENLRDRAARAMARSAKDEASRIHAIAYGAKIAARIVKAITASYLPLSEEALDDHFMRVVAAVTEAPATKPPMFVEAWDERVDVIPDGEVVS